MVSKAIELLNVEEIGCLSSCLREADEYMEGNDAQFLKHIGVGCNYTKKLRDAINTHLGSRPDYMDDSEPWAASPSLSHLSTDVIAMLSTKELLCFSNCITATLEYLDNEDQFDTRVGVSMTFARVFKTALEMELTKRRQLS